MKDRQKRCQKCRNTKDASEFFRCKSRFDGLQSRCKKCQKEDVRLRMAKPHNRAKQAARTREYQKKHPEQIKEYRREWGKQAYAKDPTRWRDAADRYMEKARRELFDTYIRSLIAKAANCSRRDVPCELIAAKKAHISAKRLIKEMAR